MIKKFDKFVNEDWAQRQKNLEVAEKETMKPLLKMAKLISFPKPTNSNWVGDKTSDITWSKRGGYAGEKTIINVFTAAKKLGWSNSNSKQWNSVTGDIVTNTNTIFSKDGMYQLESSSRYGVEASDNWYSLKLIKAKSPEEIEIYKNA